MKQNKCAFNLLLFGPPGSGKGTQSALLVKHFNLNHISTGDMFRKALKEKTTLGLKAKTYIDQGRLVPDSLVIDMLEVALLNFLNRCSQKPSLKEQGFLLDGFPRTLPQAKALAGLLKKINLKLFKILYLNVPEEDLTKRLTGRRVAEKSGQVYHIIFNPPKKKNTCDKTGEKLIQRKDDTQRVVKQRLKTYYQETAPLIEYYKKQNLLFTIKGRGSPKEVFLEIQSVLKSP